MNAEFVVGDIRVQVLGPYLVRIEQRGPAGFEDRETFTIVHRAPDAASADLLQSDGEQVVATPHFRVRIDDAKGFEGIRIESSSGDLLCLLSTAMLSAKDLPAPSALPPVWILGDRPRVVPPPWGALPPPANETSPTSGWDLANDAPDAYIFFPAASGYERFTADVLRLTGPIPLVPLYALGLWYSRYHPYSEEDALAIIDRFRAAGYPLDLFVADTDWRVGASHGYGVNEKLFPDMARFVRRAHERNVRVMLNDHPEPKGAAALDPDELTYRRDGLVSLLEMGVDLWWFDRNWHTHLQAPAPGLEKEVWGMRLYHDITKDFAPERRPLIMSNVDGIDNGWKTAPSHAAAHRFPVWWTGDTRAEWRYLREGVKNGVESGIRSLLPYVHEDLGGHHDQTPLELYVRFMQFGAFSPVARIHSTAGVHRYPWEYGPEVERIVGEFFRLRYRLLPMLYSAADDAHRSGTPLLRRCDLEWPDHPEATDSTQYLLGDDLLVAPILSPASAEGIAERVVWIPPGQWQDAWSGRIHTGPVTIGVTAPLHECPLFIRRGGLLLTTPHRESTGEAIWPDLVADAFAPMQDGEQTRRLHEDDGHSMAYQRGQSSTTEFRLSRTGNRVELMIHTLPQSSGLDLPPRHLTLRLHLPPGTDGHTVQINGLNGHHVLAPSNARLKQLFAGRGAAPGPESGSVIEWHGEWDAVQSGELRVSYMI